MNSYPIGTRDVFGEGGGEVVRIAVARMKQPGDEKHDRANEGGDASDTGERPAGCSFITSGLPGREFVDSCSLLWPSYASVHHVLLSGFTRASFTMGPVSRVGAKPQRVDVLALWDDFRFIIRKWSRERWSSTGR